MLLQFTIIIIPTDLEHGAKAEQSPGAGVDGVDILDDIEAGDDQGQPQLDDAEVNHHGPQGDPAQGGEPGPLPTHTQSLSLTINLIFLEMLNAQSLHVCSGDCSVTLGNSVWQRRL